MGKSLGTAAGKHTPLVSLWFCRKPGRGPNPWALQGQCHVQGLWTKYWLSLCSYQLLQPNNWQ